jgi:plasmid stabilization system protein ParE
LRYVLTPRALRELSKILAHIHANNRLAAEKYSRLFRKTFGTLAAHPDIGTKSRELGSLEFAFQRNYRIVYRRVGASIWITRVRHVAQLWPPPGSG